jgi:hypothetical protein
MIYPSVIVALTIISYLDGRNNNRCEGFEIDSYTSYIKWDDHNQCVSMGFVCSLTPMLPFPNSFDIATDVVIDRTESH